MGRETTVVLVAVTVFEIIGDAAVAVDSESETVVVAVDVRMPKKLLQYELPEDGVLDRQETIPLTVEQAVPVLLR